MNKIIASCFILFSSLNLFAQQFSGKGITSSAESENTKSANSRFSRLVLDETGNTYHLLQPNKNDILLVFDKSMNQINEVNLSFEYLPKNAKIIDLVIFQNDVIISYSEIIPKEKLVAYSLLILDPYDLNIKKHIKGLFKHNRISYSLISPLKIYTSQDQSKLVLFHNGSKNISRYLKKDNEVILMNPDYETISEGGYNNSAHLRFDTKSQFAVTNEGMLFHIIDTKPSSWNFDDWRLYKFDITNQELDSFTVSIPDYVIISPRFVINEELGMLTISGTSTNYGNCNGVFSKSLDLYTLDEDDMEIHNFGIDFFTEYLSKKEKRDYIHEGITRSNAYSRGTYYTRNLKLMKNGIIGVAEIESFLSVDHFDILIYKLDNHGKLIWKYRVTKKPSRKTAWSNNIFTVFSNSGTKILFVDKPKNVKSVNTEFQSNKNNLIMVDVNSSGDLQVKPLGEVRSKRKTPITSSGTSNNKGDICLFTNITLSSNKKLLRFTIE